MHKRNFDRSQIKVTRDTSPTISGWLIIAFAPGRCNPSSATGFDFAAVWRVPLVNDSEEVEGPVDRVEDEEHDGKYDA